MPEDIDRTIYKLELDDSGYIRGIDSMAASTARLTEQQQRANQTLQTNQAALKNASDVLKKAKQDLDNYTGTNLKYQQQLQKDFENAQTEQKKLTDLVATNQKAYEQATKAAQEFADVSQKAVNLQQQTTGGKILTPAQVFTPQVEVPQQIPSNLSGLEESVSATTDEFKQLAEAINLAETQMQGLDQQSEEFKTLAPLVEQGKKVLEQYGNTVQQVGQKHVSLRQQILNNNNELARLEQVGQGATKTYIQLEKETAHLTRLYQEQRDRIKVLASDTRAFDFGKAAVESAVSGFQLYTSISVLAGGASEKLQKETLQLFAAMQLLTSVEQLANQAKRGGVIATNLQSAAQGAYTFVVGASTKALKAFRGALLATGIGATIAAIGFLVIKFNELKKAQEDSEKEEKLIAEIHQEATKSYTAEVVKLDLIKQKLNDLSIPQKQRIALAKEYNKTAEEGNKIDLQQIDNIDSLNAAIDRQIKKIEERALATAAENVVEKKAEDFFNAKEQARVKAEKDFANQEAVSAELGTITPTKPIGKPPEVGQSVPLFNAKTKKFETRVLTQADVDNLKADAEKFHQQRMQQIKEDKINRAIENDQLVKDTKEELDRASRIASGFISIDDLIKPPPKTGTTKIENIFEQEKAQLLAKLADLRRGELDSIQKINDEFAAKLEVERNRIQKLVDQKKVTQAQGQILFELAIEINQQGLNKALEDFNKKVEAERKKLNDQLHDLQVKANQDSLNLLQDEFDKRRQLIDFNETRELEDQKAATEERLKNLELDRLLIGEEQYQKARQVIIETGEQEVNNIIRKSAQERQDLSADIFKKTLDAYDKAVESIGFIEDKRQSEEVQKEADRFLRGEINYETFQKNLDDINKKHLDKRNKQSIDELEKELEAINARLATIDITRPTATIAAKTGETPGPEVPKADTSKEVEDLVERAKRVSAALSNLRKDDAQADAKDRDTLLKARLESINSYASAIGDLAQSVISFWQTANEAEQKALDRSIEIQQRRVDEAQKIAERGNATYLKQETDRLKELQIARENAARRQLAIDAALQASQLLVAITGAIAKIATPGIGIAEVIGSIATIVGALATGFGLVRSLQGNQPKFRQGTTEVKRGKHPSGTDTIPAWLDEGEAVIPKKTNKKYKKTVEAIYHEKIPAEEINEFVTNYTKNNSVVNRSTSNFDNNSVSNKLITSSQMKFLRELHTIKPIPQPNYEKIREINEIKISHDGKLAKIMQDHSEKLDKMLKVLDTRTIFKTDVHYDAEGLAVRQKEIMDQMEKNRKL
jgi:hypothetical protein